MFGGYISSLQLFIWTIHKTCEKTQKPPMIISLNIHMDLVIIEYFFFFLYICIMYYVYVYVRFDLCVVRRVPFY